VTPQGAVLDPDGFCISRAAGHQYAPALSFDGANFLVVWEDEGSTDRAIYGARVTPGGAVLDPQGFCVCRAASYQEYPALSFDGANFLVVWEDLRGGGGGEQSDIYGARVTPGGAVLDSQGFCVSQAVNEQRGLALGFDGANFLVVWTDERSGMDWDIYGARVTPQGEVLDPQGTVVSRAIGDQFAPALGFDGANFLVAWVDPRGGHEWAIYGARMTPQGAVLDPEGFVISQVADDQGGPALGFDGANFLVVWQDRRSGSPDIYGVRVTPAGVVFDGGSVVRQEEYQFYPQLALGTGNQMLLVYQGWAGTVGGKTYNTDWVWGKMNPSPTSVEESRQPSAHGSRPTATVVRGVLFLPVSPFAVRTSLFDMTGRQVMALRPGPNDVRALAPGVYFVRAAGGERSAMKVRKVVLQR
jgi:phosphoribosylformylglycinamidine (FGAM) synthase PurS component